MQLKFQRRFSRGLRAWHRTPFRIRSTVRRPTRFLRLLNTPSSVAGPNIDRGDSDYDIRNSFTGGATYELPYQVDGPACRAILGGWSLNGFVLARSAPPEDHDRDSCPAPRAVFIFARCSSGSSAGAGRAGYPGGKILNNTAFRAAPAGQQGDFGRNVMRGFDASQADVGLQRPFRLTERRASFPGRVLQHTEPPELRQSHQQPYQPAVRPLDPDAGERSGAGGTNGGFNPSINWRAALDSIGA